MSSLSNDDYYLFDGVGRELLHLEYVTLHYTLHYITLNFITLHYITW